MGFADGYHSWPGEVQADQLDKKWVDFVNDYDTWTAVSAEVPEHFVPYRLQWPDLKPAKAPDPKTFEPAETLTIGDGSVIFVPYYIGQDAALGSATINVTVFYQACDDTSCLMPSSVEFELPIEIVAPDTVVETVAPSALFSGFDPSVFGTEPIDGSALPEARLGQPPIGRGRRVHRQ